MPISNYEELKAEFISILARHTPPQGLALSPYFLAGDLGFGIKIEQLRLDSQNKPQLVTLNKFVDVEEFCLALSRLGIVNFRIRKMIEEIQGFGI